MYMKKIVAFSVIVTALTIPGYAQKPTFNHLAIYVVNLEKSTNFYRNVIGLDTLANPFKDNKHVWFDIGAGNELHVIAGAKNVSVHPQDNHMCLAIPSVESFIEVLVNANIPYENSRHEPNKITVRPDGIKQIYFKDPDGYWIEINDVKK
jgi:lactoylglutathione lyase